MSAIAQGWSSQYKELPNSQKVFVRAIISNVLFHGCLGRLTEKSVEDVNDLLKGSTGSSRTSTPYFDEMQYSLSPQPASEMETDISAFPANFVLSDSTASSYEVIQPQLKPPRSILQHSSFLPSHSSPQQPFELETDTSVSHGTFVRSASTASGQNIMAPQPKPSSFISQNHVEKLVSQPLSQPSRSYSRNFEQGPSRQAAFIPHKQQAQSTLQQFFASFNDDK